MRMTMRLLARSFAFAMAIPAVCFGQGSGLSITNYQLVSQQASRRVQSVTYRADLVNSGASLQALTATLTSLNPSAIQVVSGQNTLQFGPIPANSQVTSTNTFTLQVNSTPVDFSQLQWTFTTAGVLLPANVTVTLGDSVNFPVTLGAPAPAGGVFITLATSNPSTATVSPSNYFVSQGATSAPRVETSVTGTGAGSATITASASGYVTATGQVQVTSGGAPAATAMSFWPASLTVNE